MLVGRLFHARVTVTRHGSRIHLLSDFLNKFQEPTSILVWMYGGYFGSRAMLHSLGRLRRPLLDAVTRQNVNDANEVDFTTQTICATTARGFTHIISFTTKCTALLTNFYNLQ